MKKSKIKHITEKLDADRKDLFNMKEFRVVHNKNHIDDILDDYKFVRENIWFVIHISKILIDSIFANDKIHDKAKHLNLIIGAINDCLQSLLRTHEKASALLDGRLDDDLDEKERKEKIYATVTEIVEANEKIKKSKMNLKDN